MVNLYLVTIKLFFSFTISFLLSFYLVPILKSIAFKLNILDVPDGTIKKHKQPTPYLGGVAIFIAFISALSLTLPFENKMFSFLIGSTLLLFIGLIDDLVPFKPYQKFTGQIIATLCFLRAGFYLKSHFFNNYWSMPLSFIWIIALINAFNLVDVMDGLSTLLACFVTLSFLIITLYLNQISISILLSSLLGALIAFFWYNRPKASIYLGDAGALFIGGILATVPFMINWGTFNVNGYISPVIVLAIPLLELTLLIIIRTYKKIPFYCASPDHFSIYLQQKGWSKNFILLYISFLSIILFVGAFLFFIGAISMKILFIFGVGFLIFWLIILFKK